MNTVLIIIHITLDYLYKNYIKIPIIFNANCFKNCNNKNNSLKYFCIYLRNIRNVINFYLIVNHK